MPHWTFGDERRIMGTIVDIRDQRSNKRQENRRENVKRNKGRKKNKTKKEGDREAGCSLPQYTKSPNFRAYPWWKWEETKLFHNCVAHRYIQVKYLERYIFLKVGKDTQQNGWQRGRESRKGHERIYWLKREGSQQISHASHFINPCRSLGLNKNYEI